MDKRPYIVRLFRPSTGSAITFVTDAENAMEAKEIAMKTLPDWTIQRTYPIPKLDDDE